MKSRARCGLRDPTIASVIAQVASLRLFNRYLRELMPEEVPDQEPKSPLMTTE